MATIDTPELDGWNKLKSCQDRLQMDGYLVHSKVHSQMIHFFIGLESKSSQRPLKEHLGARIPHATPR